MQPDHNATDVHKPHTIRPATFAVMTVAILLTWVFMIYSEQEQQKKEQMVKNYNQRIQKIEHLLIAGKCAEAEKLYEETKAVRETMIKEGYFYSLYPYPRQAHAMGIAECFDYAAMYPEAVSFLNREKVDDRDYYRRAAVIYDDAGESDLAAQARANAEKFR